MYFYLDSTKEYKSSLMKLLCIILAVCFSFPTFSQLDSLKGRPKKMIDSIYFWDTSKGIILYHREMNFGQYNLIDKTLLSDFSYGNLFPYYQLKKEIKEFNKEGEMTTYMRFDLKNSLSMTIENKYDTHNNKLSEKKIFSGGSFRKTQYDYQVIEDSIFKISTELEYNEDFSRFSIKYYYYSIAGDLIEIREIDNFRNLFITNYKYDSLGKTEKEFHYRNEQVPKKDETTGKQYIYDSLDKTYTIEYLYNSNVLIKERIDDCDDNFLRLSCKKTLFEYDAQKRITQKTFIWGDSLFSRRKYYYDKKANLKRIEWYFKNEQVSENFADYYYKDNELFKAILTNEKTTTVVEYKYKLDKYKNWIEQEKLINGKTFYIRKREITYWD